MQFKLCNVPLEDTSNLQTHTGLFVKASTLPIFDESGHLRLFAHQTYDFSTYLGTLSVGKWREYAGLESFFLSVDIDGRYFVRVAAMTYDPEYGVVDKRYPFSVEADGKLDVDLSPYAACDAIGFEVMPFEDAVVRGIHYYTDVDERRIRDVELAIAITTCRKEEYVRNNVSLIGFILESGEAAAQHIQVHVVDNGNTLDDLPVESPRVFLHPNPNTGGSGGFARGMMECLDEAHGGKATHVLVMDDDVEVLPEAFMRTFNLLSLVKPEYADAVIAGAMLSIPVRNEQHEDIGQIRPDGLFGPVKEEGLDLFDLTNVVANECVEYNFQRQYAAFWYCCMPAGVIEEHGLPLPLFIRCDDAEFGMRDPHRTFMTMNGICVWHMSFGPSKFRASIECFYTTRNTLILAATSPSFEGANYLDMHKVLVENMIEREWRKFAYDNVDLIMDGLEAYLAGPAALIAVDAERQFIEYGKRNTAPVELDLDGVNATDLWNEPNRGFLLRAFTKTTKNGHRFLPKRFIRGAGAAPDEFHHPPNSKVFLKERVYLVEGDGVHGRLNIRDQERFDEQWKRYTSLQKRYRNERSRVESEWREAMPYLVSPEFWADYLAEQRALH